MENTTTRVVVFLNVIRTLPCPDWPKVSAEPEVKVNGYAQYEGLRLRKVRNKGIEICAVYVI